MHTARVDSYTKVVLTAIAALLAVLVLRPVAGPSAVQAQSSNPSIYVEPGTTLIRKPDGTQQTDGKVFIDLRTGDIWGFPTLSGTPYPIDSTNTKPPVSQPIYLGRFDVSKMQRN